MILPAKRNFVAALPDNAKVLDIGCWNYSFYKYCEGLSDNRFHHYGVDAEAISDEGQPPDYIFAQCNVDDSPLPFPNEHFDAVVASHVIEHLFHPMRLMDEIFRVLKVGGTLYLECPSDRSLRLPSMPFQYELFKSLNFYDDPTHVGRPHTPQSLYRLFCMYDAEVMETKYLTSTRVRLLFPKHLLFALLRRDAAALEFAVWWAIGFSVYGIAKKTQGKTRQYVLS